MYVNVYKLELFALKIVNVAGLYSSLLCFHPDYELLNPTGSKSSFEH